MEAYHITTKIAHGIPVLSKLPFEEGEEVKVTIEPKNGSSVMHPSYPLRGLPLIFIDPFEPAVPPEDWEALNDDRS